MGFRYFRRRRREDQNIDDWLMTYADMITLLLCFFAIFLSVSAPKKEQLEHARHQVMEKFAAKDELKESADLTKSSLEEIEGQDGVSAVEEGDRITTIELNSAAFFASGSARLSAEGERFLKELRMKLTGEEFIDYQITIEGHTDDTPINTPVFPSNWELSTARAAAVVRFFITEGVSAERLRASGYADIFPKVPNRDASGKVIPEHQAQNRRVVIKLEKIVSSSNQ